MTDSADRLHRWVFLLTAGLLFATTVLRSALNSGGDRLFAVLLLVLFAWLALFATDTIIGFRMPVAPRWTAVFPLWIAAEAALVVLMLAKVESGDFYAVLFGLMSMQVMRRQGWKLTIAWIALFAVLTAFPLTLTYDLPQAIVFSLIYLVVEGFLAFFTFITGRASTAHAENERLVDQLRRANAEIEACSTRVEQLAAAEERHRLARELHDSVTQTIFSMNLTAQSAALLLPRDRNSAGEQLARLGELAEHALAELRDMGSELATLDDSLPAALKRHIEERTIGPLAVAVSDEGGEWTRRLSPAQELGLFRIAQEALNNAVKHAQARRVTVRLSSSPSRLSIEDDGCGFSVDRGEDAGGMGLASMRERADGIGWRLRVDSRPGTGTRVIVEQREDVEES